MKTAVCDRLFLAALVLTTVTISLREPDSLSHVLMLLGGVPAQVLIGLLAVTAIAALVDAFINDVLPDRYSWHCGIVYRQAAWIALAVLLAGYAWISSRYHAGQWLTVVYALYAARAAGIAFQDLNAEAKRRTGRRRAGDQPLPTATHGRTHARGSRDA
jgi:hypothetical protein